MARMTTAATSYATLSPDMVLDALDSVGLRSDGRLLALNSYENRVYQVGIEDGPPVVAKFYRPGRWSDAQILEEHGFVAELVEREIPVVPAMTLDGETLRHFGGFRFAVFERHGGRAPELEDRDTLEWMGRFLGRIHAVGAVQPYRERPALNLDTFGIAPRDFLLSHDFIPPELAAAWQSVVGQALDGVRGCYERAGAVGMLRLHGDCHVGNVLWTGDGPHFVDFDDSRSGPAVQDLWMLLSGERAQRQQQLGALLDGYEQFRDFDRRELAWIEPLRMLRLIHYSAWLARRWSDPACPAAFPWFGTSDYWKGQVQMLEEQLEAMDEPALVA